MDLYSAVKLYEKFTNKESFDDNTTEKIQKSRSVILLVISLVISLIAVYLSWSCNTALGINIGLKLLYAFFAFIFGILYLLFYLIFRVGECKSKTAVSSPTVTSQGGKKK